MRTNGFPDSVTTKLTRASVSESHHNLNAAANCRARPGAASHIDCYGDHGSKLTEIHSGDGTDYNRNLLGNILVSDGRAAAGPD
jgi:hypothetical protein